MPSLRQQNLAFVKKNGHFLKFKGKGLIHHHALEHRFKKMKIGGTVAHKQSPTAEGGAIKNHKRPYELKDSTEIKTRPMKPINPIHFKM